MKLLECDVSGFEAPTHEMMRRASLLLLVALARASDPDADWLAENAQRPGVITHESGLQYVVLASAPGGANARSPARDQPCRVHYTGELALTGERLVSTANHRPAVVAPREAIGGLRVAMELMREGDKWRLFVPPDLGHAGAGHKHRGAALVYELELVRVLERPGEYGARARRMAAENPLAAGLALFAALSQL